MRAVPPLTERDAPPFRLDLVLAAWAAIEVMVESLWRERVIRRSAEEMRRVCELAIELGRTRINHESITLPLRLLAASAGQHVVDWLEQQAVEAQLPRRKPPPAVDLVLRLDGVDARRLLLEELGAEGVVRCTVWNHRGDVVSHESGSTANALAGAIRLADARREPP